MMKILVLPLLLCGLLAVPQRATAATDPLLKCAGSKLKATGKKEAGLLNCLSKDAAKPDPMALSDCKNKVVLKFGPAFTKADLKEACTGRPEDVENTADLCVGNVAGLLPPVADTCNTGTGMCVVAATRPCKTDADCMLVKCTSAKLKAAGKGASGQLNCYSKAVGKGIDVDQACLQKASDGLTASFTKADLKGACPGDPVVVNAEVTNSCVVPVKGELPPKVPGCGNGVVEPFPPFNETCDDGNANDGDSCPASCHIDSCTAVPASSFGIHVTFTPPGGTTIAGLTFFVDYPEGKITKATPGTPGFGVGIFFNDLVYGFTAIATKLTGLPTTLTGVNFQTCQGAPAATLGDFTCKVTDASDNLGNTVDPTTITCAVTIP